MRHRKSGRQLNRNSSHRQAMFRNMAGSLVRHEIIKTTLPKAKELRRVVEPLITLAKTDSVANRRLAFARTRDNEIVAKLFNELGPHVIPVARENHHPVSMVRRYLPGYQTHLSLALLLYDALPTGQVTT